MIYFFSKLKDQHDIQLVNDFTIIVSSAMVRTDINSESDVKEIFVSWSDHVSASLAFL